MISIILPYFNAAAYINETVDSIVAQTYPDWELLVVNDCSTDIDTEAVLEIVKEKDKRIRILSTPTNGGAGIARNMGIKEAKGRYIAFCDSDDWWYPTKLEEQMNFINNNGYEFICSWYEDANENLEPYYVMKQKEKQSFKDLLYGCNIGTPGVIFDTQRIGKQYMPQLRRAEDMGLWLSILKQVDYIYTYPKALWKYRHVPGSETSNKWKQMKSVVAMYRTVLKYSAIKAWGICLFIFLPKNIIKKLKKTSI